jgi:hypothetical protein
MESEMERGVQVIDSNDLEDFALRMGEAIATWTNPGGHPPTVVFSHTATQDGFNYVGIVSGNGPRALSVETRRTSEGGEG